mmetsp:Transcript_20387/g.36493  ORF Transcript_20387/g.36493 Transcript_20387/m.36493 type:complete len:598 (-) Transcript_20387:90-1883(-)|eukprot:CAMPEP_0197634826 /NCGR_PEP_ID=MMETSP1338-20131121/10814_1 /TAXON_ID=43686 ORGANISM="Pelagodinium beii, Strain RCC1491" /NCGR_SAMPLE_ID=MMETSP1338 /ASSEMBLY_ACC=CAM_ASM_000754 /LENGTH=597 /DNA_ID=CAMNT_0043206769 /DNA_START=66 /DNA_END=1859 /DNA_ORIENTATION=-
MQHLVVLCLWASQWPHVAGNSKTRRAFFPSTNFLQRERRGAIQQEITSFAEVAAYYNARSPESSLECRGSPGYDESCFFHNVYFSATDSGFKLSALMVNDTSGNRQHPLLHDWVMPAIVYPVDVDVITFDSHAELRAHAAKFQAKRRNGLTLLFRAQWSDRWAHALFDGLYPAFMSLTKFGLKDHLFTPLVDLPNYTGNMDCRSESAQTMGLSAQGIYTGAACQMEEAFRLFGSKGNHEGELLKIAELHNQLRASNGSLLFQHLVTGSAHMGEYASNVALPGTLGSDLTEEVADNGRDIVGIFSDRMYQAHGLPLPQPRTASNIPPKDRLNVIITENKRMDSATKSMLKKMASEGIPSVNVGEPELAIRFINWHHVQPLKEQLRILRDTDIMVSGIGTALFYSAFLPYGSICLNTGWKENNIPSYGEEMLGMANHRSRFVYMPLEKLMKGYSELDLATAILDAAKLISRGFALPLADSAVNLSLFGKIIRELGRKSETSKKGLQGKLQQDGGFLCHQRPTGQTSMSDLVFERNAVLINVLPPPPPVNLTAACYLDVELLRELKNHHGFLEALGLPDRGCACVVCEACGFEPRGTEVK